MYVLERKEHWGDDRWGQAWKTRPVLLQVQRHTDGTDLPLMDNATKVLVWIALSVVIVVGGIFISNDQAAKRPLSVNIDICHPSQGNVINHWEIARTKTKNIGLKNIKGKSKAAVWENSKAKVCFQNYLAGVDIDWPLIRQWVIFLEYASK